MPNSPSVTNPAPLTGPRDPEGTESLLQRLKSVEGHVRAVTRMVAEEAYCIDTVHQISAVQSALRKVGAALLERHMRHCVTDAVRSDDGAERERVIRELMDVFDATGRL